MSDKIDVLLVGGGMISHDQILPSLYQLQRDGAVGSITVCARRSGTLRRLAEAADLRAAFPECRFDTVPALEEPEDRLFPESYREAIGRLAPHQLVVVAVPDHMHLPVIDEALQADQHLLVVKPLVLHYSEAKAVEEQARARGLFVGVEYHKRFDRRALDARRLHDEGRFGELRCGEARLFEPYYYRYSNFQSWFTKENSDPFTYVGCHYVDQVYFITGLRPVEVSLRGVEGTFPNGNEAYMWSAGRVVWENGAVLNVLNGLGYPDEGGSWNDQGMQLYFEGTDRAGAILHDDRFRGVSHAYADDRDGPTFRLVNPDYFRLVPWQGEGLRPVGYGFDSVAGLVDAARATNRTAASANSAEEALETRRRFLQEVDRRRLLATPGNSFINELVIEAGRWSIRHEGLPAKIVYDPEPKVVTPE